MSPSLPAFLHIQFSPITSWFVQSICLVIWKTPSPSGILWWISLSLPQTLPARLHALPYFSVNIGSFSPLGLCSHAFLLQDTLGFELCMLLSSSFIHLFIPPPGFAFPLVDLGETTYIGGNIQQRALQLWLSWLNMTCSVSTGTSSGGNCSCSSHHSYLEGPLELASSSWVPEPPGLDARWKLAFLYTGDVSGEVTHNHMVLFDALLIKDDSHVGDCIAKTLAIEYVV